MATGDGEDSGRSSERRFAGAAADRAAETDPAQSCHRASPRSRERHRRDDHTVWPTSALKASWAQKASFDGTVTYSPPAEPLAWKPNCSTIRWLSQRRTFTAWVPTATERDVSCS